MLLGSDKTTWKMSVLVRPKGLYSPLQNRKIRYTNSCWCEARTVDFAAADEQQFGQLKKKLTIKKQLE
jgi:hypothetical protein